MNNMNHHAVHVAVSFPQQQQQQQQHPRVVKELDDIPMSPAASATATATAASTTYNRKDRSPNRNKNNKTVYRVFLQRQQERILDLFKHQEEEDATKIHRPSPALLLSRHHSQQNQHNHHHHHPSQPQPYPFRLCGPRSSCTNTDTSSPTMTGTSNNKKKVIFQHSVIVILFLLGFVIVNGWTNPTYYLHEVFLSTMTMNRRTTSLSSSSSSYLPFSTTSSTMNHHDDKVHSVLLLPQIVVASPEIGFLDVIGTVRGGTQATESSNSPPLYYNTTDVVLTLHYHDDANDNDDYDLDETTTTSAKFTAFSVTHQAISHRQQTEPPSHRSSGASVSVARFWIGRTHWTQIVLAAAAGADAADPSPSRPVGAAGEAKAAATSSTRSHSQHRRRRPVGAIIRATIGAKRQDTTTPELPIWVDPSLSHYYNAVNHHHRHHRGKKSTNPNALGAPGNDDNDNNKNVPPKKTTMTTTTTTTTTRRIQTMMKKMKKNINHHHQKQAPKYFLAATTILRPSSSSSSSFSSSSRSSTTTTATACTQECLRQRLELWLEHYRALGIQQFYILDHAVDDAETTTTPLLTSLFGRNDGAGDGVTYIRTNTNHHIMHDNIPLSYVYDNDNDIIHHHNHHGEYNHGPSSSTTGRQQQQRPIISSDNRDRTSDSATPTTMQPLLLERFVLDNAILKAANAEWMLFTDLDEFVVLPEWQQQEQQQYPTTDRSPSSITNNTDDNNNKSKSNVRQTRSRSRLQNPSGTSSTIGEYQKDRAPDGSRTPKTNNNDLPQFLRSLLLFDNDKNGNGRQRPSADTTGNTNAGNKIETKTGSDNRHNDILCVAFATEHVCSSSDLQQKKDPDNHHHHILPSSSVTRMNANNNDNNNKHHWLRSTTPKSSSSDRVDDDGKDEVLIVQTSLAGTIIYKEDVYPRHSNTPSTLLSSPPPPPSSTVANLPKKINLDPQRHAWVAKLDGGRDPQRCAPRNHQPN